MSYDIYLEADTGGPELVEVWSRNHTSNTAPMWRAAGVDLAEFHGRKASDLAPVVAEALMRMQAAPATYRKYDAPNGWGTYATTCAFLEAIQDACALHPNTTVRISR
jgi:hypothetical protein